MHWHWVSPFLLALFIAPTAALLFVPPGQKAKLPRTFHALSTTEQDVEIIHATNEVPILPAHSPLPSFCDGDENSFSLLTWNILLPNSSDNWWCHKQYPSWVDMEKRQWPHRRELIRTRLLESQADIICIQEADGDTFEDDFSFMAGAGYDHVLHKKFRFRNAVFFLRHKFELEEVAHKDRTLVTALRCTQTSRILSLVNCHLSGGAAPERRLRQVHDGLQQVQKWTNARERILTKLQKGNRPSPKAVGKATKAFDEFQNGAVIVSGDFNSDGNTAVRKLLVDRSVEPEWREPQYPNLQLTSKTKQHSFGTFVDAAELAYGGNVCDGDYADKQSWNTDNARPPTYVVPNLASLLLLPVSGKGPPRTEFGLQVARGFADALNLQDFCESEIDQAFEQADNDGNGLIDRDEVQMLLESAYVATYGQQIEQEHNNFFRGFGNREGSELTKEQFISRLKALQQDCEGERKAFGLARGLGLQKLSETDMEQAFERIDLDGNGLLDEDEYQTLLESIYVEIYGEEIKKQKAEFFQGFESKSAAEMTDLKELSKEQFKDRLLALHQELEGGRKGAQLAEVRTEADAQTVIERFTPLLQEALDEVFDKFSSNGNTLTQEEVNEFLIKTNGELGRGGTFRHTSTIFSNYREVSKPALMTRQDWYGVFARELAEGKWWSVVYDLEICGAKLRTHHSSGSQDELYHAWLDYIYFDSQVLSCKGVQDAVTEKEQSHILQSGAPNELVPSDHLPVAAIFSWK